MASEFLFIEEVAELTRVPISCVRFWIRTGKLASLKPGRRVLVRKAVGTDSSPPLSAKRCRTPARSRAMSGSKRRV